MCHNGVKIAREEVIISISPSSICIDVFGRPTCFIKYQLLQKLNLTCIINAITNLAPSNYLEIL